MANKEFCYKCFGYRTIEEMLLSGYNFGYNYYALSRKLRHATLYIVTDKIEHVFSIPREVQERLGEIYPITDNDIETFLKDTGVDPRPQ